MFDMLSNSQAKALRSNADLIIIMYASAAKETKQRVGTLLAIFMQQLNGWALFSVLRTSTTFDTDEPSQTITIHESTQPAACAYEQGLLYLAWAPIKCAYSKQALHLVYKCLDSMSLGLQRTYTIAPIVNACKRQMFQSLLNCSAECRNTIKVKGRAISKPKHQHYYLMTSCYP